jgi:hypothetical protein
MQEEVTQKMIALSITTSRMTAMALQSALRKVTDAQKNHTETIHKGKQTLKQLLFLLKRQNISVNVAYFAFV